MDRRNQRIAPTRFQSPGKQGLFVGSRLRARRGRVHAFSRSGRCWTGTLERAPTCSRHNQSTHLDCEDLSYEAGYALRIHRWSLRKLALRVDFLFNSRIEQIVLRYPASTRSLAFSATAMVAALVIACGIPGNTEASITRRPATPLTRRASSTTAPIRQVPTG